ncbi:MAG: hypothetical protein ABIA67_03580 [Candidatus Margulisiibacteriota bacterium]
MVWKTLEKIKGGMNIMRILPKVPKSLLARAYPTPVLQPAKGSERKMDRVRFERVGSGARVLDDPIWGERGIKPRTLLSIVHVDVPAGDNTYWHKLANELSLKLEE